MKLDRFIRVSIGVLIALLFVIAIGALLFVTESALNVWDRLLEGPALLRYGYLAGMAALLVAAAWLVVRLLVRRKPAKRKEQASRPLTRDEIEARLRAADEAGVETGAADEELRMLAERQQTGSVHLCFFGEISTGKSSLLKALVPAADVAISAVGGSTLDIRHFRWQNDNGVEVLLTDVPGTAGIDTGLDRVAEQEARRAHVVLFVCDGDLTRAEKTALERLLALGKPLVLVLNKSDRYDAAEQALLMERLLEHVQALGGDWSRDQVVAVSAGGEQELIERSADGTETVRRRTRAADVGVLAVAINRLLQRDRETLD
ncbi:MAG: GTPase, partial [Woeseia sp.]